MQLLHTNTKRHLNERSMYNYTCLMLILITCSLNVWELMDCAVCDHTDRPLFETINQNLSCCHLPTSCHPRCLRLLHSEVASQCESKVNDVMDGGYRVCGLLSQQMHPTLFYYLPLSLLLANQVPGGLKSTKVRLVHRQHGYVWTTKQLRFIGWGMRAAVKWRLDNYSTVADAFDPVWGFMLL